MKKRLLVINIAVIAVILFYYFVIVDIQHKESTDAGLYSRLQKKDSLSNKVSSIYSNRGLFFTFDDGRKYSFPASTNYEYDESDLDRSIEVGDSILKKPNNDTIFLFKSSTGDKKLFIMGTYINFNK